MLQVFLLQNKDLHIFFHWEHSPDNQRTSRRTLDLAAGTGSYDGHGILRRTLDLATDTGSYDGHWIFRRTLDLATDRTVISLLTIFQAFSNIDGSDGILVRGGAE